VRRSYREIVEDYAAEAIATLNAPANSFTNADLWWVIERAARSLAEIEKATLRVVALKVSANDVPRSAELLGMAPISLERWLKRRSQPPPSGAGAIRFPRRRSEAVRSAAAPGRAHAPRRSEQVDETR